MRVRLPCAYSDEAVMRSGASASTVHCGAWTRGFRGRVRKRAGALAPQAIRRQAFSGTALISWLAVSLTIVDKAHRLDESCGSVFHTSSR